MKRFVSMAFAMMLTVAFAGCSQTEQVSASVQTETSLVTEETVEFTLQEVDEALDRIYIAGVDNVPSPSCGFCLPAGIPMDYLEITATGVLKDTNETVDLLDGKEIAPDEWVVFEDLNQYSKAECTIKIKADQGIYSSGRIDLLNFENGFQRPGK